MLQKPKVVVILGATATGKSHCAIEIAKQFQGEIISGDSMLVYKNMNIGTAKPTAEELAAVPHHLVDILPPDASFSVVDFKERAAALITEINARGHLPIIAGGTGLYIKALLEDYAFNNADEDSELRRRLEAEAQEKGALALHARLQELAPDCIMTVETSGIPLAMQTARAFNVPLVIARHTSDITEGSTVNINYVSGSTKVIQNMAMPKRALQPGNRVLIVDDVMKGGGTAKGMIALAHEVGAQVVGKAFLIATAAPDRKLVEDYTAFFTLHNVDEEQQKVTLEVNK